MAYTEDDIAFCAFVDKRQNSWEFGGRSDDFDGWWDGWGGGCEMFFSVAGFKI